MPHDIKREGLRVWRIEERTEDGWFVSEHFDGRLLYRFGPVPERSLAEDLIAERRLQVMSHPGVSQLQ